MRIVIDLQGAQGASRDRGIGRYSLEFALSVARNRNDHDIVIALNGMFPDTIDPIRQAFDGVLPAENIRVWHGVSPATGHNSADRSRREMSGMLREVFLESLKPDIVHLTSIFEGYGDNAVNTVSDSRSYLVSSTFYDLIPLNNSDIYLSDPHYKTFYLNIASDLMNIDMHLAISDYSRLELISSLHVDPIDVVNVYAGVDRSFKKVDVSKQSESGLRLKFNITRPFIMYSGASDERKNHLRLIEAFSASQFNTQYHLVLVGRVPPETFQRFVEHGVSCGLKDDQLIITNTVSDDELVTLYNKCSLFVFPAWQEGFGLPIVEAMQCGAPVIGSNTSSIPEVIGTPDALFDPFDVVSIRDAIDDALKSPAFREKMIEHGAQRAAFFSWDRVGSESIKAFEGAVFTKNKTPQFRTPVTPPSSVEGASADCRIAAIEAVRLFLADRCATPAQEARVGWQASLPKISNSELATVAKSIALNHPQRIMKQLFVDVSELVNHDARTGIQRVVRSVLSELMSFPPEGFQIEPVYATPNGTGYRYARTFVNKVFGGLYTAFPDDIVDMQGGDIFLGLDLQHSVVLAQENTYSEFRNSGVEVYFVVYDLLPILLREKFPAGAAALHDQWLTAISRADGLVCISRSVADELITWLDQHGVARNRPLKIGWFHLGADMQQSLPSKGASSDASILNGLTKLPTFLMVGTLEPRKGHFQTVSAFERLWADGHDVNLVIVGKQGWNVDKLVRTIKGSRELGHRLLWLPSASDEYLETLYANSDCLIAASEGEGFGLPLVEAAQHGIPIFARALPVFQELAGGAAFYFEGSDATSMADALTEWLGQFAEGKAPASRNMPLLTWKQSTAQLMNTIIKKDWYQTWVSADGWRYKASDLAMHTIVGRRVGQEMHTSGQAGFFLFGPYVTLSPGKYGFRLYGSYDGSGKATYDLVGNHGSIVLEETTLKKHPQWGEMVSFDFTIEDEIGQFEMRMKVDRFANLSVSRLELFPIDFADE